MNLKQKLNEGVSWQAFALAMAIIASIFGYQISIDAKADAEIKGYNDDLTQIKIIVGEIKSGMVSKDEFIPVKSDVSWIKANLDK